MTDASTISIPTDAILILLLLIVFALIGYCFNNILDNQTNEFVEKLEKLNIKKLNFIPASKFWGIDSLAIVAIRGSILLRIQAIQNLHKGVSSSHVNIKTKTKSTKFLLSTNNSFKNNNFLQVQYSRTEDFSSLLTNY